MDVIQSAMIKSGMNPLSIEREEFYSNKFRRLVDEPQGG